MTAEKKLLELLRRRQEASQVTAGEAFEAKQWQADVEELMAKIQAWLKVAQKERLVQVKPRLITLIEERAGKYAVPALTITTPGCKRVEITPAGFEVIGSKGRVDLVSGPKSVMLPRFGAGDW